MAMKTQQLTTALKPILIGAGFAKKGESFFRKTAHFWQVINWQTSQDAIAGKYKFTVNIGLHDLRLSKLLGEEEQRPDVWDCHYRIRLGQLLPEKGEKWWIVPDGSLDQSVIDEFDSMIRDIVIPFFDGFDSAESLLSIWKSGPSPGQTNVMRERFISLLDAA
jgi:hypothetical protein